MPSHAGVLFVGVDIGTFETKGVIADSGGRVVTTARSSHQITTGPGGRVEHDAEAVWWEGFVRVLRTLLEHPAIDPARIAAVGCSGIGPCVLPVDAEWRPLGPAILYGVDTRATTEIALLERRLGSDAILRRCGNRLSSQSAGPKIAWLKRHEPEQHRAARYFVTSQSFLTGRLTGVAVIDHPTASYFHPIYDLAGARWDVTGCEDFIDAHRLPRIAWPGDIAGAVSPLAAARTGLRAGTPVIVGTTDAQAEALASGVVAPGDMMVMYGSSSFMLEVVPRPVSSQVLWAAPYVFPGTYALAAGTSTAGTLTRWIAELLQVGEAGADDRFAALVALAAESSPGAAGLTVLPYASGERTPLHDPSLTAAILGLRLNHTRADLARAVLEGIAHSMANAIETYTTEGYPPQRLHAVGGGTRNPIWLQAVSDILAREQRVIDSVGAAAGDAALAALAIGTLCTPDDTRNWAPVATIVRPDETLHGRYAADHRRFLELTTRLAARRLPEEQPS